MARAAAGVASPYVVATAVSLVLVVVGTVMLGRPVL